MIKAIIFDCFGVVITDALEALLAPIRKNDPDIADAVVEVLQAHNRGLITPAESNAQIAELLGLTYDAYRQAIDKGEAKNQLLTSYIKILRTNYKVAMLSNIDGEGLRRRFTQHSLDDLFDVVVASSDIGYAKPEMRAYTIVAERLQVVPEECVFIDDRQHYCDGAIAAGMHAIYYANFDDFKAKLETLLANPK